MHESERIKSLWQQEKTSCLDVNFDCILSAVSNPKWCVQHSVFSLRRRPMNSCLGEGCLLKLTDQSEWVKNRNMEQLSPCYVVLLFISFFYLFSCFSLVLGRGVVLTLVPAIEPFLWSLSLSLSVPTFTPSHWSSPFCLPFPSISRSLLLSVCVTCIQLRMHIFTYCIQTLPPQLTVDTPGHCILYGKSCASICLRYVHLNKDSAVSVWTLHYCRSL